MRMMKRIYVQQQLDASVFPAEVDHFVLLKDISYQTRVRDVPKLRPNVSVISAITS